MQKPSSYLRASNVSGYIGLACLVVGIIGDVLNLTLGLEPNSWLLVAIGFLILALWRWFEWAEAKKRE